MSKKKILFVVYDFVQAGGQRVIFDVCKALDKNKYEIDVLQFSPMNYDKSFSSEYYYQPTLDLGIKVYSLSDLFKTIKNRASLKDRISNKIKSKLGVPILKNKKDIIIDFLSNYKFINFSGVSVYESLIINNRFHLDNAIIYLMTAKFQDTKLYDGFNKQMKYNFISGFTTETAKIELNEFSNYDYIYFPLSIDVQVFEIPDNKNKQLKIGVFTRLSSMKPLDPYLFALKLLLEQGLDAKLCIYGSGDPDSIGLTRQIEYLYLQDHVELCGHTDSIKTTLIQEKFDIVWYQAVNSQVAGLAAFEVALGAVPQVLWDFNYLDEPADVSNYFKSFTNLTKFVNYSKELLLSKDKQKEVGLMQQQYIIEHHNIDKNILLLEKKYDS